MREIRTSGSMSGERKRSDRPHGLQPPRLSSTLPLRRSSHHVDVVAAAHDVVFPQFQPAVADAFAGLDVVLVAMPRTDERQFVGEGLAAIGPVRRDEVHHLVDQDALAGRPAGMKAVIAVGVVGAVLVEHADLMAAGGDDAAIPVGHLRRLGNEPFGHVAFPPCPYDSEMRWREQSTSAPKGAKRLGPRVPGAAQHVAERSEAKWCAADPGPRLITAKEPGSRICGAALRAHALALHRVRDTRHHSCFQGMTLRSISWNSTEVMSPRMPMVTMPTNMMSTCRSSHEFQIR